MSVMFFFFQAEDGIRDLVRSRGPEMCIRDRVLGVGLNGAVGEVDDEGLGADRGGRGDGGEVFVAVSYTHLTLPTSDLV